MNYTIIDIIGEGVIQDCDAIAKALAPGEAQNMLPFFESYPRIRRNIFAMRPFQANAVDYYSLVPFLKSIYGERLKQVIGSDITVWKNGVVKVKFSVRVNKELNIYQPHVGYL